MTKVVKIFIAFIAFVALIALLSTVSFEAISTAYVNTLSLNANRPWGCDFIDHDEELLIAPAF